MKPVYNSEWISNYVIYQLLGGDDKYAKIFLHSSRGRFGFVYYRVGRLDEPVEQELRECRHETNI